MDLCAIGNGELNQGWDEQQQEWNIPEGAGHLAWCWGAGVGGWLSV